MENLVMYIDARKDLYEDTNDLDNSDHDFLRNFFSLPSRIRTPKEKIFKSDSQKMRL